MQSKLVFEAVQEPANEFLALFPHRFDYIYAVHPEPGKSPAWQTERRYPLSDRVIQQGDYLYGVRFGSQTHYCLLDIDSESLYHPDRDPWAIARIVAALESIGLVSYVACTSSYSGGLHLYFPFQPAQSSWAIASVVSTLLSRAGFCLKPGQLEVFPNPKPYAVTGSPSLFNAHRLPMQAGSYLLNGDFQPIWSEQSLFVQQWSLAQYRNSLDVQALRRLLKQAKQKPYCLSGKADQFIQDLNAEIELGWTGYGQTNRLLGRITMRAYIFNHVLEGGSPLAGQALVNEVVRVARSLPGYYDWCRHQHEIEHRAAEWARCIEQSHYFHYGASSGKFKAKDADLDIALVPTLPTWNQQQSDAARDRIRRAIADLLEKSMLPAQPTARFKALVAYGIGGGSLYRHRDLWHPAFLVENPPNPPITHKDDSVDCVVNASTESNPTSLFSTTGGNPLEDKASGDFITPVATDPGRNSSTPTSLPQGVKTVRQVLHQLEAQRAARQEAARLAQQHHQRRQHDAAQIKQRNRMQQFLISGDPILVAEALAWAQIHPELLDSG